MKKIFFSFFKISLRKAIGLMPQDPLLFHRSIAENISYGKPGATPEDIQKVAELAHAHEFIKDLPKGYDTLVGERGVKLSGGERQRVAIARALAVQPRLLLCDEPTGNLDQDTGREVIELFTELHDEGMTLLMVTHEARVSERAQRVYRLQDGKLMDADPGEGVR